MPGDLIEYCGPSRLVCQFSELAKRKDAAAKREDEHKVRNLNEAVAGMQQKNQENKERKNKLGMKPKHIYPSRFYAGFYYTDV